MDWYLEPVVWESFVADTGCCVVNAQIFVA